MHVFCKCIHTKRYNPYRPRICTLLPADDPHICYIHLLQLRAAKPGDLSVHRVRLPRQVCFCRRYQCTDAKDAAIKLRDTYIATARTGKMSMGAACLLYVQVPPARNSICYAASLSRKTSKPRRPYRRLHHAGCPALLRE